MTETGIETKPLWSLALLGSPCDFCLEPADGLLVFPDKRVVVHTNRRLHPCEGVNPVPVPLVPPQRSQPKAEVVKRKVGRPKSKPG